MESTLLIYASGPLYHATTEGPIVHRKLQIERMMSLLYAVRKFAFTPANRGTLRERSSPQGPAIGQ